MKQFCVRGHDTFVVGRHRMSRACNACRRTWRGRASTERTESDAATRRRRYMRDREKEITRAAKWQREHPERHRINVKSSFKKCHGVNFWVVAASKSR